MKLVSTVIQSSGLEQVRTALRAKRINDLMVYDVTIYGGEIDHVEIYKAATYAVDFVRRIKVETIVSDELAGCVLEIFDAACDNDRSAEIQTWVMDVGLPHGRQAVWRATPRAA